MKSSHGRSGRASGQQYRSSSSRVKRTTTAGPADLGSSTATQFSTLSSHLSNSAASSTTSTNATSASKFSLSTSFVNLNAQDISFFDQIIDLLPTGADDFATLKRAYNQLRGAGGYRIDEDKDAFLWDTLLKLIQVRGKNWAGRWDAVRMAIGLEPRASSGSEREQEDYDDDDDDEDDEDEYGSSSASDTVRERRRSPETLESRPNATRAEIEALRKRMALLTAEAGSLVGTIKRRVGSEANNQPPISSILATRDDRTAKPTNRIAPNRHLRFAAEKQPATRSQKATIVESASDEEATRPRSVPQRATKNSSASETREIRPLVSQRQFDEVVARSRNEREAHKRAQEEQQEAIEEANLRPLLEKADRLSSLNLTKKCYVWWKISTAQQKQREADGKRARDELTTGKALEAWRSRLALRRERMGGAEKVDVIRCKLRAWRVWRRRLHEARDAKKEEKRSQLKGAYTLTRSKMEQRMVKESFLKWKIVLMERRTAHFRTQHLVRGAFCLWRIQYWRTKTLNEKEEEVKSKFENVILSLAWEKWIETSRAQSMSRLGEAFHGHQLLRLAFSHWTSMRQEKATLRRKEALADRWRARRTKRSALMLWHVRIDRFRQQEDQADGMRLKHLDQLQVTAMKIWKLREREHLFSRIRSAKLTAQVLASWNLKYQQLLSRLAEIEGRISSKANHVTLRKVFAIWRETTSQFVISQQLASEKDRRKIKAEAITRWNEALEKRKVETRRAERVDGFLLQRFMWSMWSRKHIEAKAKSLQHRRNHDVITTMMTFWRARSAERRQETKAIEHMQSKIDNRIQRECLGRWTAAVIERKSLLMEAGEKRDALVVQEAWKRWIEACLRHEDMLNLSKSFIDVKKEEHIRGKFTKWLSFARAERNRRERVEQVLNQKKKDALEKVFDVWYDRFVEATLRPMEYEALLQRQKTAQTVIFKRWKSRTKSLPAIRLEHVRIKSHAFYTWLERLPHAKSENRAAEWDRKMMQEKGFRLWYATTKAKRALRAAARFGGPSAARLRATSHLRQRGISNPFGVGGNGSSSPAPMIRVRNLDTLKTATKRPQTTEMATPVISTSLAMARKDQGSLRESDLISRSSERREILELDRNNESNSGRVDLPPALQRWMQNVGQGREGMDLEDSSASSEPPSSILDQRWILRREAGLTNRTPSPPASQAQSEATMRVKSSPRKLSKTPQRRVGGTDTAMESTIDLLRSRRKQRRSMIFDDE